MSDIFISDIFTSDIFTSDIITSDIFTSDIFTSDIFSSDSITSDIFTPSQCDRINAPLPQGIKVLLCPLCAFSINLLCPVRGKILHLGTGILRKMPFPQLKGVCFTLTLCLPRSPICKSVNVPRSPICTVIHMPISIVHSYCSMKRLPLFWFALSACVMNLAFWNPPYDIQVKRYSEFDIVLLNVSPIPVCPKIMWHTGGLHLANNFLLRQKGHFSPRKRVLLGCWKLGGASTPWPPPPPRSAALDDSFPLKFVLSS